MSTGILFPFDKLCVDTNACNSIWDNQDMTYLRNHPLLKMRDGFYIVLNTNLLIDRIYQCLKFTIFDAMQKKGVVNEKGKVFDNFGVFCGMLGTDFSEVEIFYHIMHKTFDVKADLLIEGRKMKNEKIPAEPDFYLRIGEKVFIFEYKDNIIGDEIKFSGDYNVVKEGVLSRICKDDGMTRKGAGQILNSINEIVNNHSLDVLDPEAKNAKCFYPIIVTTDRTFSALGIQYILIERFSEIIRKWNIPILVRIPMVLDLDTLVIMSKRVEDGTINFPNLIEQYLNLNDLKLSSFETFYSDTYRDLKVMRPEDVTFLFGDMLNPVKIKEQ